MIPIYFRKKNTRVARPTQAQPVAIFWPGDNSPQDFFGNRLTVRRAEGVKLLTKTESATLRNLALEFLRYLMAFNLRVSIEDPAKDLPAVKILGTKSKLRNLRNSHSANLVVTEPAFATDNVENTGNPSFYTLKNARTRLWLPNGQAIGVSNNILAELPFGGHAVQRCSQALGFEIQEVKLLAVLYDQSKVDVTNLNALCFVLNRPFLATGEPALNFIKSLTKALYVAELFPELKGRFLVNIEGVLLGVQDFISVFDIPTLFQILGVHIDSSLGLSEAINFQEPKTSNYVVPEDAAVARKVKISLNAAQSMYAAEDLDFVNKQWVAAVSYLILYLRSAQKYLVGCEIEISSGDYYTVLRPSF